MDTLKPHHKKVDSLRPHHKEKLRQLTIVMMMKNSQLLVEHFQVIEGERNIKVLQRIGGSCRNKAVGLCGGCVADDRLLSCSSSLRAAPTPMPYCPCIRDVVMRDCERLLQSKCSFSRGSA
ncbi:hypothetical protein J6590_065264 [Homalodisca vitripennis]|nr:hypothetical protein J6590_065264 [Homalodisca vitripennis]